jgi:hypothetical protein
MDMGFDETCIFWIALPLDMRACHDVAVVALPDHPTSKFSDTDRMEIGVSILSENSIPQSIEDTNCLSRILLNDPRSPPNEQRLGLP